MNPKKILPLLAAVALAPGLAACGGDDGDGGGSGGGSTDPGELGRADIGKEAEGICRTVNEAADEIEAPANLQDAGEAARYFSALQRPVGVMLADLEKLTPDAEVKADWDAFVAKEREAVTLLGTIVDKARARDQSGLQDVQELDTVTDSVSDLAEKVDAPSC